MKKKLFLQVYHFTGHFFRGSKIELAEPVWLEVGLVRDY